MHYYYNNYECKYSKNTISLIGHENLHAYKNSQEAINNLYNNLYAPKGYFNKIPTVVNHIWLTHPNSPRELSDSDIENTLKTKETFVQDSNYWQHIVWTNNKNLIPASVTILEKNNIEVREIKDYTTQLELYDEINKLIVKKEWGIASDALRYDIIREFGGVYSDLNFEFIRTIDDETNKYDFFAQDFVNYFFAAKPNHPVLVDLVKTIKENLNTPKDHIRTIDSNDIFTKTIFTSLLPFGISYIKNANKYGNTDIVFPSANHYFELEAKEEWLDYENNCISPWAIMKYPNSLGLCANESLLIGNDGYQGNHLTWLESNDQTNYLG